MSEASKDDEARQIAEEFLHRTSTHLFANNFDAYADLFELPHTIETFNGVREISTKEDLRAIFDNMRAHFEKLGVTDYVRRCIVAEFLAPDLISTSHETRVMRGTELLYTPYPVHGQLKKIDGEWKIMGGSYAIRGADEIERALMSGPEKD